MDIRETEWREPLAAFAPFSSEPHAVLLDSGASTAAAPWSFLCVRPASTIERRGGKTLIDGAPDSQSPFSALRRLHERRKLTEAFAAPPLASGLVGFAGYECGALLEPRATGPASTGLAPDLSFAAYDAICCFDKAARRAFIAARNPDCAIEIETELGRVTRNVDLPSLYFAGSNFSAERYRKAVADVICRILDGAIYQANISHRLSFKADEPVDAFSLFSRAVAPSGASHGAFLNTGAAQIVSLSPERFFSVTPNDAGRIIHAEPIKGTRPRGRAPDDDARQARALLASDKDRAENIMIADLTRNDLSRICDDGSIREDAICELMTLPTVHHLVSRISGRLSAEVTAVDALAMLFPCGSVTGAPKIEAMRTIAEIETVGRGPYCGAIGYIDDRGGADFSVAIRTAIVEGRRVTVPVGGGVTLRSDPEAEYQETLDKAEWFFRAAGVDRTSVS